jgi:hypothetical protein
MEKGSLPGANSGPLRSAPMRIAAATVTAVVLATLAASAGGSSGVVPTPASRSLDTSLFLSGISIRPKNLESSLRWAKASGVTSIRLPLEWSVVARSKPASPGDPADPAYNWSIPDHLVNRTATNGLEPMLSVYLAPKWAGGNTPSPKAYGLFAKAAARRYSGTYQSLPRVKVWMIWNEPNLKKYFSPQFRHHRMVSAKRYRKLVNAAAGAIHGVHGDNIVVGGELAPVNTSFGPGAMAFSRAALCVSAHYHSTCNTKVNADAWSVHPYTSGGPAHKAYGKSGVSFGDLPRFQKLVRAAVRLHHLHARGRAKVWVTEMSWDSRPPDHLGVPVGLESRWAAYALYRAWTLGIPMFTWFRLVDEPMRVSPYQSGLYWRGSNYKHSRPKPVLRGFRFPFVARQHGRRVYVWGRVPDSNRHPVAIELRRGHSWKQVSAVRSNASGVFFRTLHVNGMRRTSSFRARLLDGRDHSLGFPLNQILDKYYVAFGS